MPPGLWARAGAARLNTAASPIKVAVKRDGRMTAGWGHLTVWSPPGWRVKGEGAAQRHALALLLGVCWLAAPVQAADLEACWNLLDQRNALAEQAMKAEIALVRSVRERICPVLSQQADGANANDRNEPTIDYQSLIDCRHKAEAQLQRSQRVLYVNRQQFRFYTAAGAELARQADGLAREWRDRECPQLR